MLQSRAPQPTTHPQRIGNEDIRFLCPAVEQADLKRIDEGLVPLPLYPNPPGLGPGLQGPPLRVSPAPPPLGQSGSLKVSTQLGPC